MALDPAVKNLIDTLNEQGLKSFEQMSIAEVRGVVESFSGLQAPKADVARVVDTVYPGPGGDQAVRLYIPESEVPLPIVVYIHGGGWVAGSLDVIEQPCRALATDAKVIVAAPSYRMAPEHKFPAAPEDTFAALNWVVEHAAEFGGDGTRVAIMGDSAGGNLAAVTALRARDTGAPALRAQVLIYPVIDGTARFPSREEYAEGYLITTAAIDWFWEQYLATPEDAENPYASPAKAADLSGLPATLLLLNEYEVTRDEGVDYGRKLADQGVPVQVELYEGLVHAVYWMTGAIPRSAELHGAVVEFLGKQFAN
ncbi:MULTISPECIES: alpha/beta hydrolase [unclassified Rhodococcus (in: high G+C Gram-positive bacteria)]|uniref:alpha/beta hydrolase n=1 Tax=unclassified Rhodococcus (in: high G+C Gram-positive bacteria) TaxID=192944 RepID=UPI00163A2B44|nr:MULTISPECIES: alpha/beta hydrolase [unclassified Rhodococcus (in: high G+C Gram-positive bacteria)]MBC2641882.1 alpha/beta hydrolase [Rhodococcus sp. 3A]MBC2893375.1 alpha/beta hydrolase [Rhodococcus sp. 4CII]